MATWTDTNKASSSWTDVSKTATLNPWDYDEVDVDYEQATYTYESGEVSLTQWGDVSKSTAASWTDISKS